ncbi:MAG: hypothetical protein AAGI10_01515 [Pseudomonadota bacterium]
MRVLAVLLALFSSSAHAGVAAYEACVGDGYEARVMAKFMERFPSETCEAMAQCPPVLMQSAEALTRAECRADALDDCESEKCRLGLTERWRADGAALRAGIEARLERVDLTVLPPLKARRLGDPERWLTEVDCTGDAAICEAVTAGQALGDLERLSREVEALP